MPSKLAKSNVNFIALDMIFAGLSSSLGASSQWYDSFLVTLDLFRPSKLSFF